MQIETREFLKLNELNCSSCGGKTILKADPGMIVKLEFVLTESAHDEQEIIPEEIVESFHQEENVKQPSCSLHQSNALCEGQREVARRE